MSPQTDNYDIRRILVALDNSPASRAALQQAAALAAGFNAKLVGLFIEDITLLRLAELSITEEIGLFSGASRRLEVRYVERQFRGQAEQSRRALASLASRFKIAWQFRSLRGVVAAEIINAASDADLIVLGRIGLSAAGRRRRLGSTARAVLFAAPHLTLLLHPGQPLGLPAMVLYDGSPTARRGLTAATQLTRQLDNHDLAVFLLADSQHEARSLEQTAKQQLSVLGQSARYLWRPTMQPQTLAATLEQEGYNLLITPGHSRHLERDTVLALIESVQCPVLLVRAAVDD